MMDTESFLIALGGHLAGVDLAQFDANGSYVDDPDRPAVLFAGSDTPDHCVVLSVVGRNEALNQFDVACAFRATGINTLPVENLADAVSDHFRTAFDVYGAGVWHGGSLAVLPTVTLPGGLTLVEVQRTTRGTAELTSPAKHKGSRFTRTDQYTMTVR